MPQAQPFLKWAGGKSQLLEQYAALFPQGAANHYFEPFAGSGAVYFYLQNRREFASRTLSDVNQELVNCYQVVRDQVDALLERLHEHKARHEQDEKAHYYAVRERDRQPDWEHAPVVERAARMIYLNKTCYNGLWRVNSKGQFNVPIGRYKNPDIANVDRLRAASAALQGVAIVLRGFEEVTAHAAAGDFVYFDPPYHPLSETANFTSYSADSFGPDDQRRLANVFAELDRRGCQVMLSNSDTSFVRDLYAAFTIRPVEARRAINSKSGSRGPITEVVVTNY